MTGRRLNIRKVNSIPQDLLESRWPYIKTHRSELYGNVKEIVSRVRKEGDRAVSRYTQKFDGIDLDGRFRITGQEIEDAYNQVTKKQVAAIEVAISRLAATSRRYLQRAEFSFKSDGIRTWSRVCPISRVGCYIPGGLAAYPSSVVMATVPARVAGVKRIVICTPPNEKGNIHPLTLVAADRCQVDEVYSVGGAQAIAALAYGTESIKKVQKIVGPGNKYVTLAKRIVSADVQIDLPAGPSELLVLADNSAKPEFIALDLISQAEHDIDASVLLVTSSNETASKVESQLRKRLSSVARAETIFEALQQNALIYVCQNMEEGVEFANKYAPEHVQIMAKNAKGIAEKITSAGVVLIGDYSPVAASDYCLGTNHILPTGGFGNAFSGLSVNDFMRSFMIVESSRSGLKQVAPHIQILSESEGLPNHGKAVEGRFIE
ncbi:MAG: histidinol dehydrogenase [Candidatus Lokiarchaeota archaeon]|nr:histidinol dehydrogenase [Candidatus Lokiarchaeota archaeon]